LYKEPEKRTALEALSQKWSNLSCVINQDGDPKTIG
jgi:hypothetical protein